MKALLGVLAAIAVGLLIISLTSAWRAGALVIGAALCVAAAIRLGTPRDHLGDLAVRSRALDGAFLLALGLGVVALANTIPSGH